MINLSNQLLSRRSIRQSDRPPHSRRQRRRRQITTRNNENCHPFNHLVYLRFHAVCSLSLSPSLSLRCSIRTYRCLLSRVYDQIDMLTNNCVSIKSNKHNIIRKTVHLIRNLMTKLLKLLILYFIFLNVTCIDSH